MLEKVLLHNRAEHRRSNLIPLIARCLLSWLCLPKLHT